MVKQKIAGFIIFFMLMLTMMGCNSDPTVQICYDTNNDYQCDDGSGAVNTNNYMVIDGKKSRIYLKETDSLFE